ncbi:unnamed protein product [Meloidogyne enterolobii]|uniref:Uncharacterized protein n=1 Tax=Meloidogyne enterolobii TaxID=390850 RepID=A0ACB0XT69_MELEN
MPESLMAEIRIAIPLLINEITIYEKFTIPIPKAEKIYLTILERSRWLKTKIFNNITAQGEIINSENLCRLYNFVKFSKPIIKSKLARMVQLEEGIKINIKYFGIIDKNTKNIKISAKEISKWTGDGCLNEEEQKIAFEGQRLLLKV